MYLIPFCLQNSSKASILTTSIIIQVFNGPTNCVLYTFNLLFEFLYKFIIMFEEFYMHISKCWYEILDWHLGNVSLEASRVSIIIGFSKIKSVCEVSNSKLSNTLSMKHWNIFDGSFVSRKGVRHLFASI